MAHEDGNDNGARVGQLPPLVVGPVEVNRLKRELAAIDDTLLERTLRKQGSSAQMLKTSQQMDRVVNLNELNLLHEADRQRLSRFLDSVSTRAPVLHISFSADPPSSFLEQLMAWLRENIHPQVLVTVGIQPTIAAGCTVRGPNKYFDLSLRQDFKDKRALLLEQMSRRQAQEAAHE